MKIKNKTLVRLASLVAVLAFTGSSPSASADAAANKAVDLNLHYKYDVSGLDSTNAPKGLKPKKTLSKLGEVSEERNTSASQDRALINPYHRTVSTGISF